MPIASPSPTSPAALWALLAGGDRRSIGRVAEALVAVRAKPELFPALIKGLSHPDPCVALRCADAAEKLSAQSPAWLAPHKRVLLTLLPRAKTPELRWHLAQMLPRLPLTGAERATVTAQMKIYLQDESRITQAHALTALAELARGDAALQAELPALLRGALGKGSPALKARARRLLHGL